MKKAQGSAGSVRRSVVLSARLLKEVERTAPAAMRGNFNRLVRTALEEFVRRRDEAEFAEAMARMARDPAIRAECRAIEAEFRPAEPDGLP